MIEAQSYAYRVGTLGNIEMSECLMFYAGKILIYIAIGRNTYKWE